MPFPLGERRHVYMYVYVREKEGWRVYNWIQTGFGADRRWGSGSMMHDEGGIWWKREKKGKKGWRIGVMCVVWSVFLQETYIEGGPRGRGGVFFNTSATYSLAGWLDTLFTWRWAACAAWEYARKEKKGFASGKSALTEWIRCRRKIRICMICQLQRKCVFFPMVPHTSHILDLHYPTLHHTTKNRMISYPGSIDSRSSTFVQCIYVMWCYSVDLIRIWCDLDLMFPNPKRMIVPSPPLT